MVTLQVSFEELLEAIDKLPEAQKQIVRVRLDSPVPEAEVLSDDTEERLHQYRLKIYARAREYWQHVGDTVRLALTDAELDEQFWLFYGEGIPRLKEDEGTIEVPETSMMRLLKLIHESPIEFEHSFDAADADEILRNEFADYIWERKFGETTKGDGYAAEG